MQKITIITKLEGSTGAIMVGAIMTPIKDITTQQLTAFEDGDDTYTLTEVAIADTIENLELVEAS